jgi:dynein heavy chain
MKKNVWKISTIPLFYLNSEVVFPTNEMTLNSRIPLLKPYYNWSRQQVTNQMVRACKNFVTDRGMTRVWDHPRQPLIEKLTICLKLNEAYQTCFQKTKVRISLDPSQKPFEFSEMSIFGKFDAFCRRVIKVSKNKIIFDKIYLEVRFLQPLRVYVNN